MVDESCVAPEMRTSLLPVVSVAHAGEECIELKEIDRISNLCPYRDVRTYGFYETYYHEARGKV